MSALLQVEYICHGCGLGEGAEGRIKITVAHRKEGENVVDWIESCGRLVGNDHARRSPHCASKKCDLMIPLPADKEKGVGF